MSSRPRRWAAPSLLAALGIVAMATLARADGPFSDLDRPARVLAPRTVDLLHTRFDVTLDFDARAVSGTSTLTVAGLAAPAERLLVDAVAMEIRAVRDADSGAPLDHHYDGERLEIRLAPPLERGDQRRVAIDYRATPHSGMHFVRPSPRRPRGHREVWTQGQEVGTRRWLPSLDRLDDFGTSEAIVTVPDGLSVLSNGRLVAREAAGPGAARWHWRQEQPHATYLMFLAAGPFEAVRRQWRGVPVAFWHLPWHAADEVERTFAPTLAALDFFADELGLSWPWAKYDQIAVSDYTFGGMENLTATLLNDAYLHDERAAPDYSSQDVVVHELAHHWFGDLVTCRDWAHLWLNEGFASWAEMAVREHLSGRDEAIARFFPALEAALSEQRRYRRPVVTYAYTRPSEMFDSHSYSYGAWVLHALRGWIDDDDVFFAILRQWVQRWAHRPAETEDFRRVAEDVSGRDLRRFFEQHLYRAGAPELEVAPSWDREASVLTLKIRQVHDPKGSERVEAYLLPLDVRLAGDDGAELLARRIWIEEAQTSLAFPLGSRPAIIEIDPRAWTPGRVEVAWGRQEALAALRGGSTVVTRRLAAQRLAERVGDAGVAEALTVAGERDHWFVAAAAVSALAKVDSDGLIGRLERVAGHPGAQVRAAVAAAMRGRASEDAGARELIERLLDDRSFRVIAAAARVAPDLLDEARARRRLTPLLGVRSPWEDVASAAADGLGRVGGARSVAALLAAAGPTNAPRKRYAALGALGQATRGEGPALARRVRWSLVKALRSPEELDRRGALEGIEALGDADAIEALREHLARESSPGIKRRARRVIAALQALEPSAERLSELEKRAEGAGSEVEALRDAVDRLEQRIEAIETGP